MQAKDGASVGRTASIVRSHRSAATSRNQSLIKKNIAPNDTHPSDVLVERFQGWKGIVKQLIAYFEVRRTPSMEVRNNTDGFGCCLWNRA